MAARKNLSIEVIAQIKEAYKTKTSREVAKEFGISQVVVRYHGGSKPRPKEDLEEKRRKSVISVSNRRRKVKEELVKYKGGCCERCGYNKYIGALEFHHKEPSQKDFSVANKGATKSLDFLKTEVDKCMLVCANCHREIHEELRVK